MLPRGDSFEPRGEPAGRAEVKAPPTYTVLPTISWVHATPFIWAVGRDSAVGMFSGRGCIKVTSAVAGVAASTGTTRPASAKAMTLVIAVRLDRNRVKRAIRVLLACLARCTR